MSEDAQPQRITDEERAYLLTLITSVGEIPALQNEIAGREAAWRSYSEHLTSRYGLGANDAIAEDGTIQRHNTPGIEQLPPTTQKRCPDCGVQPGKAHHKACKIG